METPQRKIIEKNEYNMLYDKKFILLTLDSLKTVYFAHFQSLLQCGIISGVNDKPT